MIEGVKVIRLLQKETLWSRIYLHDMYLNCLQTLFNKGLDTDMYPFVIQTYIEVCAEIPTCPSQIYRHTSIKSSTNVPCNGINIFSRNAMKA